MARPIWPGPFGRPIWPAHLAGPFGPAHLARPFYGPILSKNISKKYLLGGPEGPFFRDAIFLRVFLSPDEGPGPAPWAHGPMSPWAHGPMAHGSWAHGPWAHGPWAQWPFIWAHGPWAHGPFIWGCLGPLYGLLVAYWLPICFAGPNRVNSYQDLPACQ